MVPGTTSEEQEAMATLLEASRISPQTPCVAADLFLPLTFSDIRWVNYHPLRQLIFYKHPCSAADFLDTIVPKLKQSLSLTLKHYPPVAGNLLLPSDNEKLPMIRYVAGDSVSMTVAASGRDFDDLVGNHARDADQFYDLMPQMPPATEEPGYRIVPLMAIQVTLFPGRGVCFAVANHHSLGDASSVARFTWAWAAINKLGGDEEFLIKEAGDSLPIFDRSVVKYPPGLDARIWGMIRGSRHRPMSFPVPTDRVRATYILHQADIEKLKDFVSSKKPGLGRVSSFVVTVSYVWTCFVKSSEAVAERNDEHNAAELFTFATDLRGRMNPPVPANYFGNCLGVGMVKIERKELVREDGFVIAAEAISEQIKNKVNSKEEMFLGRTDFKKLVGLSSFSVSGSPKFDLSEADFGWGKARKLEVVSMDGEKYSMSLCNFKGNDGGLEVGLSLPKDRMDAFAAIFAGGLQVMN